MVCPPESCPRLPFNCEDCSVLFANFDVLWSHSVAKYEYQEEILEMTFGREQDNDRVLLPRLQQES